MSRLYLFVLVLFATTAVALSQQAEIVPLSDASWRLHLGDDPRCATVSGEGCTLEPARSYSFAPAPKVWMRAVVRLPDSHRAPQQLGLLIEQAPGVYEVFVNGHLIGSRGDPNTRRGPFNTRSVFPFSSALAQDGSLTVSIRAHTLVSVMGPFKTPHDVSTGPLALTQLTLTQDTTDYLVERWQHYLCFLLVFCIGLFFLLLYSLDKASPEHLWLALLLFAASSPRIVQFGSIVNLGLSTIVA